MERTGIVQLFEKVVTMISSVSGPLLVAGDGHVVVSVGGLGLRIECPQSTVAIIGSSIETVVDVALHTTLVVREDSLTLYGFEDASGRDTFDVLLTVSGIGPRLALAAVDALGVEGLRLAVSSEDIVSLQRIPGVGKKTAQRMVLEIGDKLGAPVAGVPLASTSTVNDAMRDAVEAGLEQLGWPRAVASRAVGALDSDYDSVEAMLRAALSALGSAGIGGGAHG